VEPDASSIIRQVKRQEMVVPVERILTRFVSTIRIKAVAAKIAALFMRQGKMSTITRKLAMLALFWHARSPQSPNRTRSMEFRFARNFKQIDVRVVRDVDTGMSTLRQNASVADRKCQVVIQCTIQDEETVINNCDLSQCPVLDDVMQDPGDYLPSKRGYGASQSGYPPIQPPMQSTLDTYCAQLESQVAELRRELEISRREVHRERDRYDTLLAAINPAILQQQAQAQYQSHPLNQPPSVVPPQQSQMIQPVPPPGQNSSSKWGTVNAPDWY